MSELEERLAQIASKVEKVERTEAQRQQQAAQGRFQQIAAAVEKNVNDAEAALARAYDEGDGEDIAKAQKALTAATVKKERFQIEVEQRKSAASDLDNGNLQSWKKRHADWYGVDAEMTKASHEIDRQIRSNGVLSVGSKEYFDAIDRAMAQKYPDRLSGTPATAGGGYSGAPNTASRGRIARSVAEGYRRMGINVDDPKVAERMVKNRQTAVAKGILPEQPVNAAIKT